MFYKEQINYLFGDSINVNSYSFEDKSAFSKKDEDIFLVTTVTFDSYKTVLKYIEDDKPLLIGGVTLTNETINILKKYPYGTKALLVNSTSKMANETITLLYSRGINNIEFFPFYPDCKDDYSFVSLAITPGKKEIVPKNISDILDIGNRILDINTILEIASASDCEYLLETNRFINYFENISDNNTGIESLITKTAVLKEEFNLLLQAIHIGIIVTDKNYKILNFNNKAAEFLEKSNYSLLHNNINNIIDIPQNINCNNLLSYNIPFTNKNNENFNVSITPINRYKKHFSNFFIISKEKENQTLQNKLRNEIIKKGHKAKYTFDDIITNSKSIIKTKNMAMKMANTNATILITGESGTGKELFAHSIHNHSNRRNQPFVAINCGAITDTLLESELFGYEEGAFTGAKKGGKIGLFEIANNGTLFLDEIEGMSENLQFKLLRVIKEKEIIKVGGDRIIKIDVRIIAVTNENLSILVQEKKFRKDLYYRLNTLPLTIPPLRERKEDIRLIIDSLKKEANVNFAFTNKTKDILINYDWPGNIRELKNCMEYFFCLDEKIIEPQSLPAYILECSHINLNETIMENTKSLKNQVLNIMYNFNFLGKGCGRKIIMNELKKINIFITEAKIRTIFNELKEEGYIISSKGRGGSHLTEKGLNKMK
ncbi:MAG: sigma-54 interaction domain-containing protein [Fusobacterium sp.]